ncbi:hypothetical protein H257_08772 [Aphanomyces astaci]|uniref:Uncharacterized protein n=1 Tax=Aphanomyces astaci TaxID=112090 RepID=W4GDH1_APHAT|nr:hypothetical protein H257_08772 [Aphanomyces astaci]ETV77326.1 hypothetical protein H257_08772 [Aphanomyces astaci]|eukprot:XP_009833113.1 hypothetical protein H257_08772 [Aphanomyces astaci]
MHVIIDAKGDNRYKMPRSKVADEDEVALARMTSRLEEEDRLEEVSNLLSDMGYHWLKLCKHFGKQFTSPNVAFQLVNRIYDRGGEENVHDFVRGPRLTRGLGSKDLLTCSSQLVFVLRDVASSFESPMR